MVGEWLGEVDEGRGRWHIPPVEEMIELERERGGEGEIYFNLGGVNHKVVLTHPWYVLKDILLLGQVLDECMCV